MMCILTLLVKGISFSTGTHDAAEKLGAEKAMQPLIQNLIQIQVKEGKVTIFSAQVHYVTLSITKQVLRWQEINYCFSLTKPGCSSIASREFSSLS